MNCLVGGRVFYKGLHGLGLVAILASCKGVSQEEFETVSLDLTETQARLSGSESALSDVEFDLDKLRTQVDTVLPVIKLVDMFMEIGNNPPTEDKEADVM